MSSSSVWVQLYYKGEKNPEGDPVQIYQDNLQRGRDWNVHSLKALVKEELELDAKLNQLKFYRPNAKPPFSEDKALNSRTKLASLNLTEDDTLIVVAPARSPVSFVWQKCKV